MDDRLPRTIRMRRAVGVHLLSTFLLLLLVVGPVFAVIPYTPSNFLYSSQKNGTIAYLLRPSNTTEQTTQFLSLNISGDFDQSNPNYEVLLDEVPFQADNDTSAFVPVIDQDGIIKVYTGNCQNCQTHSALWQFTPDTGSSIGNGTWEKLAVNVTEDQEASRINGPNYLSAGFAYASSDKVESSVYAFGGMCPVYSDWESWIVAANYSQTMTVLKPSDSDKPSSYQISTTGDRAPPIPEAGFTVTPLLQTHASTLSGKSLVQQDFILIGGHTQRAFINMSQLAVFSLPQSSWSIINVNSAVELGKPELAIREKPKVEPRSGHTAVLSPDGSKVIVFGGWVGDTSVPANPQLAILEIGEDLTGSVDWTWKLPSRKSIALDKGTGIYGHGATMLPGGVMMIAGGYRISQSSKRSIDGPQLNSQVYLYNVTSGTWVSSYTNPNTKPTPKKPAEAPADAETTSHSSTARKAGLGAGIGLGIPAVAAGAFLIWLYLRRRRVRRSRDEGLRKLALDAQRNHFWTQGDMASSIRNPSMRETGGNRDYPWNNTQTVGQSSNWRDNGDAAAERTGLLMDIPSPTKSSRPNLNARMYRPPVGYNEYRRSDGTGDIHPIDEREEDEAHDEEQAAAHESSDPFLTPRSTIYGGEQLFPNGVVPAFAPGLDLENERTSSNLSDSSASAKSAHQARGVTFNQSSSLPSSGRESPEKSSSSHSREAPQSRPDSATIPPEKRYSSESYSTAHTTISQRQAEGEHLLQEDSEPSISLDLFPKPLTFQKPRASEWMGNVRRVLSVTRKRAPANGDSNAASVASGVDRKSSMLEPGKPLTESEGDPRLPRRSVSASAELFRRKQGARDWGAGNRVSREMVFQTPRSTRDDSALHDLMDSGDEDDWDIEGAAEGRRVQVTFTVPREKLRVVNATAGDMDNLSEKSVSRSNSGA